MATQVTSQENDAFNRS